MRARDLAVEALDDTDLDWADALVVSVPMHTASRLAGGVVERARRRRGAALRVVLAGLYARQAAAALAGLGIDAAIAGEVEAELVVAVRGGATRGVVLDKLGFLPPRRDLLPPPQRYAHLVVGGARVPAGHLEASRGCVHHCRHCPVPTVYAGRIRIVPADVVVADARAQWAVGARHLTLGDPDALNAPTHALRVLRAVHAALPDATLDITAKVEHVLRHRHLWPELRSLGVVMVTSAVESTDDTVLRVLDKGHTRADAREAARVLRHAGIEMRPSLLPFTPWGGLESYLDLLDALAAWDLVSSVDPVQLSIRLLVPSGSLLLDREELRPHLTGAVDAAGHAWRHPDHRMDELAAAVGALVADATDGGDDPAAVHAALRGLAARAAVAAGMGWRREPPPVEPGMKAVPAALRPRLSEAWFCCAEPTALQRLGVPAAGVAPGVG